MADKYKVRQNIFKNTEYIPIFSVNTRAVSIERQSMSTWPPWILYQFVCILNEPSNLSWNPVLELSFIPMRTSSSAHWPDCFPERGEQEQRQIAQILEQVDAQQSIGNLCIIKKSSAYWNYYNIKSRQLYQQLCIKFTKGKSCH